MTRKNPWASDENREAHRRGCIIAAKRRKARDADLVSARAAVEAGYMSLPEYLKMRETMTDDHQYWRKYPEQKPMDRDRDIERINELLAENERLREALEPFAEIAKRAGWASLTEDHPTMTEHVTYAPADDIAPGAVYCLHVSAFVQAHNVLAGGRTND